MCTLDIKAVIESVAAIFDLKNSKEPEILKSMYL